MKLAPLISQYLFLTAFCYGVSHLVQNKLSVNFLSLDISDFDFPLMFWITFNYISQHPDTFLYVLTMFRVLLLVKN
jgi:hypothetical protein